MGPGIGSGAKREVRRAIFMTEVVGIPDSYGSVVGRGIRSAGKLARLAIQFPPVTLRHKGPFTNRIGHEAHTVFAGAVIEAFHLNQPVAKPKAGPELHVQEWFPRIRTLERCFEDTP